MGILSSQYEPPVNATIALLRKLCVKVTAYTVNEALQNHPAYPSILSISDSLVKWKVHKAAIRITTEKLTEIPLPAIAYITKKGGGFITLTAITNNTIKFIDENNKEKTEAFSEFEKYFGGVVLLAEAEQGAGETNYKKALRKEQMRNLRFPIIIAAGIVFIILNLINYANFIKNYTVLTGIGLLEFLKLAGIFITSLLLWYEVDKSNPALQKICTGLKNTNCNANT